MVASAFINASLEEQKDSIFSFSKNVFKMLLFQVYEKYGLCAKESLPLAYECL